MVPKQLNKFFGQHVCPERSGPKMKKIVNLFEKQPHEDMPNLLGWLMILAFDAAVILLSLTVYATCMGCSHTSSVTRRGPGGDTTVRSASYAGGLVTEYNEEFESDADYERCLSVRAELMPLYRAGRVLNWAEMTDIQQTCFQQTSGFGMAGWNMNGFPGMGFGYAWGASPALSITPGLR